MKENLIKKAIFSRAVFTTEAIVAAIALLFVALYSITMLNFTESVILVGQRIAAPAVLMGIAMAKLEHDRLTWNSREG